MSIIGSAAQQTHDKWYKAKFGAKQTHTRSFYSSFLHERGENGVLEKSNVYYELELDSYSNSWLFVYKYDLQVKSLS